LYVIYLGSNDSTNGGSTPVVPATYGANIQDIVDYILANATGTPLYILLVHPSFYSLDPGSYNTDHIQALFDYAAELDSIADGVQIFTTSRQTRYQIPMDLAAYVENLNVHLTNP